jgi:membrane protein YqaA with SNARE-associated domain
MSSVLQIAASIAGVVAAWYLQKIARTWLQKWQDSKNAKESTENRTGASAEHQGLSQAYKKLKDRR